MRFLAAALLLLTGLACAQVPAKHSSDDQLRFTLILSRHGIRPPLTAAADLNRTSSEAWPEWEVPLGHLTPHGADALRSMGTYMRLDLSRSSLFPASGCLAPADIYLYSDASERNISSTRNTFAAFAPNCDPLPVYIVDHLEKVQDDPLFLPVAHAFAPPAAEASLAAMRAALGDDPQAALSPAANPALTTMAQVLAPDPTHPPIRSILDRPVDLVVNPAGDPIVTVRGPLFSSSSLVEDLLLEFTDNKPMSQVGWGRVDEATLRSFIPLHVKAFGLSHRTPFFARAESSNMLAHILDTLNQAFDNETALSNSGKRTGLFVNARVKLHPVRGAIGPPTARLVYISAHDTNLSGVSALLDLHWTADGLSDDTPPDSQLIFELWQNEKTKATNVRIHYRAQTLDQLRSAEPLSAADPPGEVELTPPGCESAKPCAFAVFDSAARKALDPAFVQRDMLPTHVAK